MVGSHISIYGEVQGSGFRSWAKEQSLKFNLVGWGRKASDGSIEIYVQGEEEDLNSFISLCWDGPPLHMLMMSWFKKLKQMNH